MKLLAIETSTEYCSAALWQDGAIIERCERVGQKHSELLMAMVDAVLKEVGITIRQVEGIAFGKGPGSFTGVRIACGVAQGLALGAEVQVVGVCTLEALAEAAGKDKVIAALDARMGELYLAAYARQAGAWSEVVAPVLCHADTAPMVPGAGWVGVGSGFAIAGELLKPRYALHDVDAQLMPQAGAVARLGAAAFARGEAVDAALALPLYLRDKVALTTAERAQ
jgi:tRNA threonylcarbamoyladenosine biosynthesis protein TsaB